MPSKKKDKINILNKRKGQSLIEFALLLPFLLLLILGTLDLGRMFYTQMVITNAAREGANYLVYFPEDKNQGYTETFFAIQNEADGSNVEFADIDVMISGCCTAGQPVNVTISTTVDLVFDGVLQLLGLLNGPVQLTGSVRMMVQ